MFVFLLCLTVLLTCYCLFYRFLQSHSVLCQLTVVLVAPVIVLFHTALLSLKPATARKVNKLYFITQRLDWRTEMWILTDKVTVTVRSSHLVMSAFFFFFPN